MEKKTKNITYYGFMALIGLSALLIAVFTLAQGKAKVVDYFIIPVALTCVILSIIGVNRSIKGAWEQ